MKITVKLFAGFHQYLPCPTGSQGIQMEIEAHTTPVQLLKQLKVPCDEVHLVLVNGVYIEVKDRELPIFSENDILAVWPAVAGG